MHIKQEEKIKYPTKIFFIPFHNVSKRRESSLLPCRHICSPSGVAVEGRGKGDSWQNS